MTLKHKHLLTKKMPGLDRAMPNSTNILKRKQVHLKLVHKAESGGPS